LHANRSTFEGTAMKDRITTSTIAKLAAGEHISDTEIRGFIARRLPSGTISFGLQYSAKNGKRRWLGLGLLGNLTVEQARTLAKKRAGEVADRRDPVAEAKATASRSVNTVRHVCSEWVRLYAKGDRQLRSADKIEKTLTRLVYPAIGDVVIYDLSRAQVTAMLDRIAAGSGAPMADVTLGHLTGVLNWWMIRDETFKSPIVKGMRRSDTEARKGKRALSLDELKDVWQALDLIEPGQAPACFASYVKALFLTATRRCELATMHTSEFDKDGKTWTIPAAKYKTKRDHMLSLPDLIRDMLPPRKSGFIFSSDGGATPFKAFSKSKAGLDRAVDELRKRQGKGPMPRWRLHDARRTWRSLAAQGKLGISAEVAERCLGHTVGGVEDVYNVHNFEVEKRDALQKVASYIINNVATPPTGDNVVALTSASAPAPTRARRAR
jgi:integrase